MMYQGFERDMQMLADINRQLKTLTHIKKRTEARIQGELSQKLEDKNTKYYEVQSEFGSVALGQRNKVEIDDIKLLKDVLGEGLSAGKFSVIVEEKVKCTDKNFERALISLYKGNYKEHDLDGLLTTLGIDEKDKRVVLKKLKGEYAKDKELLMQYKVLDDDLEEELDIIHEHKNWEVIQRYFGDREIDMANLKIAMYIDESLAFSSKFRDEEDEV